MGLGLCFGDEGWIELVASRSWTLVFFFVLPYYACTVEFKDERRWEGIFIPDGAADLVNKLQS